MALEVIRRDRDWKQWKGHGEAWGNFQRPDAHAIRDWGSRPMAQKQYQKKQWSKFYKTSKKYKLRELGNQRNFQTQKHEAINTVSTTGQWAETKRLWMLSPECDVCITCSSSGLGRSIQKREQKDTKSEKWWMTARKLCLPGTLGQMTYELTEIVTARTRLTLKPVKISA